MKKKPNAELSGSVEEAKKFKTALEIKNNDKISLNGIKYEVSDIKRP